MLKYVANWSGLIRGTTHYPEAKPFEFEAENDAAAILLAESWWRGHVDVLRHSDVVLSSSLSYELSRIIKKEETILS
jgi:hypothetical protein